MIVEIFGLPGSGKTFLARELAEKQGFQIIKIRSRTELIFNNIVFFLRNPIKFIVLFWYVIKNIGYKKLCYFKIANAFFNENAKHIKALRDQKALLDQGYFQNILSLFEHELNPETLLKYTALIPKPDFLLILDASKETRRQRTDQRIYLTRKFMGKEYIKEWQERAEKNYRLFLKLIDEIPIKYGIINADQNIEKVYKDTIQLLSDNFRNSLH